jgi:hypothetical protein
MAIRDKFRASAASYLEPGEQIQAAFAAQSVSQWMALISFWIIILKSAYRVIIVTDRRILVFQAGKLQTTKIKSVLREVPRTTKIGPPSGLWYKTDVLGEKLFVHKRYAKDIEAADAAQPAAA